jgi:hypothetical protein
MVLWMVIYIYIHIYILIYSYNHTMHTWYNGQVLARFYVEELYDVAKRHLLSILFAHIVVI